MILFFFGLSAGTIGRIKGSSFVLWFAVGAALPFFGTIAAVLYRNERLVGRRRCEECNSVLPIHDQVCSRCGADLDWPEVAVQSQQRLSAR